MGRGAAVSAIDLIRRRVFAASWSHKSGNLSPPFLLFFTNFHSHRPFSSKVPTIDFSCVKELDDAIHMFHEMKKMRPQPSVPSYNKLLSVTVKMKQYSSALYVFAEMRWMDVRINEFTLNMAINSYCLLKRVDLGFAIMGVLFKTGYEPDVKIFGTLIKGLFLDDKAADATKLFKKLWDFGICEANDVMFHMIHGLCKAGHVFEACDLVRRLEIRGWKADVWVYNTLINGLCRCGMVDDAFELLSKMIDKGVSPDVVSYSSMIQGLCDVGRWKDVEDLFYEMANFNISLNVVTFSILINAFCKEGKVKEAEDLLEIMIRQNICPSVVIYNSLMDGYCLRGEMNKAKQVLDRMVERGIKPNIVSYGSLINGYCKKGRVD